MPKSSSLNPYTQGDLSRLKNYADSAICSKCQGSMVCIDEFRTSAMVNFVKLMELWKKEKKQSQSDKMEKIEIAIDSVMKQQPPVPVIKTENDILRPIESVKSEQVYVKVEPEDVINEDDTFDTSAPGVKVEDSDDDDDGSLAAKNASTKIMLANVLQNMYVVQPKPPVNTAPPTITLVDMGRVQNQTSATPIADMAKVQNQPTEKTIKKVVVNFESSKSGSSQSLSNIQTIRKTEDSAINVPDAPGSNRYPCLRCGMVFHWRSNLARHMRSHKTRDAGGMYCAPCDKKFASVACYKQHLKISQQHGCRSRDQAPEKKCEICQVSFHIGKFKKHMKTHDAMKDLLDNDGAPLKSCVICKFDFNSEEKYNAHMKSHDTMVFCDVCNKWLMAKSYKAHLQTSRKHVKVEKLVFTCEECDAKFALKVSLHNHIMSVHKKVRPYKCSLCPAAYLRANSLKRHFKTTHKKQRPEKKHLCSECGVKFITTRQLEAHMVRHTGERPFKCEICLATFGYRSALYTHNKLVHENVKRIKKKSAKTDNSKRKQDDSETMQDNSETKQDGAETNQDDSDAESADSKQENSDSKQGNSDSNQVNSDSQED
ncbi:hypothetical protein NE865_11333 [Phthorimaea operculella]|nr:hypothetical protein NE865_11333 [Phthorimaea operculella]